MNNVSNDEQQSSPVSAVPPRLYEALYRLSAHPIVFLRPAAFWFSLTALISAVSNTSCLHETKHPLINPSVHHLLCTKCQRQRKFTLTNKHNGSFSR